MNPVLDIVIDANGNVKIDVSCVEGSSCEDITDKLVRAIGKVEEVERKIEYDIEERPDYLEVGED